MNIKIMGSFIPVAHDQSKLSRDSSTGRIMFHIGTARSILKSTKRIPSHD